MEQLISIIIGCISIGVILSAPMGPIGILCVQRTLNKGRSSGLYTGIGAAVSDIFYCLLGGLGISVVTQFIETNSKVLQIVGSVILVIYALYMIIHNPVNRVKDSEVNINPTRDMITGFLFTVSNPLILFLIFPLFARFSFPSSDIPFYGIVIGYVFIALGAMLWWAVITYAVDKVRSQFNIKSMIKINRVMGSILLAMSLYGIANAAGLITF